MKKVYPERSRRVAVGLSGGVDSAVSAYLLKKQGFDISGVYLHCFDDDAPGCRSKQDRQDALKVAVHLKIPFQVLDFRRQYKSAVIDYFKKEYLAGLTPNPDVICNRDIKFGLFIDWAIKNDFDYVATGHYARLESRVKSQESGSLWSLDSGPWLLRPMDEHKDQTYFLWAVPRQNFSRVLFPLADLTKKDTRSLAKLSKIPVADKPDSTGICFIGEVRVEDFLKKLGMKEKVGEVVIRVCNSEHSENSDSRNVRKSENQKAGNSGSPALRPSDFSGSPSFPSIPKSGYRVIGTHRGVAFYTIGQRHGFTINPKGLTFNIPPLYIIAKDVRRNRLVVGFGAETYRSQFQVSDCNWLVNNALTHQRINASTHCFVRIRHCGDLIPCSVLGSQFSVVGSRSAGFQSAGLEPTNRKLTNQNLKTENREQITVILSTPQRGVAAGQSAVFYSKEGIVLGGGVIQ